jgi:hypothetical protein
MNNMRVTISSKGIANRNKDLLWVWSETSKFVKVPFLDFKYINPITGIKTHPMIKNEIKTAFDNTSYPNMTISMKSGIVNNGWPVIEIKPAIFFIVLFTMTNSSRIVL